MVDKKTSSIAFICCSRTPYTWYRSSIADPCSERPVWGTSARFTFEPSTTSSHKYENVLLTFSHEPNFPKVCREIVSLFKIASLMLIGLAFSHVNGTSSKVLSLNAMPETYLEPYSQRNYRATLKARTISPTTKPVEVIALNTPAILSWLEHSNSNTTAIMPTNSALKTTTSLQVNMSGTGEHAIPTAFLGSSVLVTPFSINATTYLGPSVPPSNRASLTPSLNIPAVFSGASNSHGWSVPIFPVALRCQAVAFCLG